MLPPKPPEVKLYRGIYRGSTLAKSLSISAELQYAHGAGAGAFLVVDNPLDIFFVLLCLHSKRLQPRSRSRGARQPKRRLQPAKDYDRLLYLLINYSHL